jgi:hypothetical protein
MMYETDANLEPELQKIGCYAESIAIYNPEITDSEMNAFWDKAKMLGYIDSSLDLVNPQGFVDILGYPLKFRDGHSPGDTPVNPATMHLVAEWFNPATNFHHFVVMDGRGLLPGNVKYDPIQGGSRTVREGYFVSYRIFDKV